MVGPRGEMGFSLMLPPTLWTAHVFIFQPCDETITGVWLHFLKRLQGVFADLYGQITWRSQTSVSIIQKLFFINSAMILMSHLLTQCTNVFVLNVANAFNFIYFFTETVIQLQAAFFLCFWDNQWLLKKVMYLIFRGSDVFSHFYWFSIRFHGHHVFPSHHVAE